MIRTLMTKQYDRNGFYYGDYFWGPFDDGEPKPTLALSSRTTPGKVTDTKPKEKDNE